MKIKSILLYTMVLFSSLNINAQTKQIYNGVFQISEHSGQNAKAIYSYFYRDNQKIFDGDFKLEFTGIDDYKGKIGIVTGKYANNNKVSLWNHTINYNDYSCGNNIYATGTEQLSVNYQNGNINGNLVYKSTTKTRKIDMFGNKSGFSLNTEQSIQTTFKNGIIVNSFYYRFINHNDNNEKIIDIKLDENGFITFWKEIDNGNEKFESYTNDKQKIDNYLRLLRTNPDSLNYLDYKVDTIQTLNLIVPTTSCKNIEDVFNQCIIDGNRFYLKDLGYLTSKTIYRSAESYSTTYDKIDGFYFYKINTKTAKPANQKLEILKQLIQEKVKTYNSIVEFQKQNNHLPELIKTLEPDFTQSKYYDYYYDKISYVNNENSKTSIFNSDNFLILIRNANGIIDYYSGNQLKDNKYFVDLLMEKYNTSSSNQLIDNLINELNTKYDLIQYQKNIFNTYDKYASILFQTFDFIYAYYYTIVGINYAKSYPSLKYDTLQLNNINVLTSYLIQINEQNTILECRIHFPEIDLNNVIADKTSEKNNLRMHSCQNPYSFSIFPRENPKINILYTNIPKKSIVTSENREIPLYNSYTIIKEYYQGLVSKAMKDRNIIEINKYCVDFFSIQEKLLKMPLNDEKAMKPLNKLLKKQTNPIEIIRIIQLHN